MTSADQQKIRAATLSIATAATLTVLKFTVSLFSGSLAVLSSAIDSMLDILMSAINFVAIRHATQPADANHAYGHGKFETMASLVQALIIGGSGVWIILESIRRLLAGSTPAYLPESMAVLGISIAVSWLISWYLRQVARKTDSPALHADSLHFRMDVYTNLALLTGLACMQFWNIPHLDPLLSLAVGSYILLEALRLIRTSLRDVLDEQLPEDIRQQIAASVQNLQPEHFRIHHLRTRRAGSRKLIDFHLNVCKELSVAQAHRFTDQLEQQIEHELGNADVTIHIEPCEDPQCPGHSLCSKITPPAASE